MDENIDHLDFEPSDPDLKRPVDASRRVIGDPRNFQEATFDEIDQRLADVFLDSDIVQGDEEAVYDRDAMLSVGRAAYIKALRDSIEHPEVITKILGAMSKPDGPGLKTLSPSTEE